MTTTRSRNLTTVIHSRRCLPAVLLLALFAWSAFPVEALAQQKDAESKKPHEKPYALIFGTVWGPDDRPVYGIKVRIRRAGEKKTRWELISDHNGEFAVRLPAGRQDYVVMADTKGVKTLSGKQLIAVKEAEVHIENDERSDIGLHLKY
jgi:hypothetical protein